MADLKALFWDVGGILLTNGWDRASRRKAVETFGLDAEEFESRTVFYRPRDFTNEAFKDFMFAQSAPYPEPLAIVERLAHSRRYLMATLNNESLELNLYRINRFGLRRHFTAFLSSCFLGVKKPDEVIYRLALQLTQLAPTESLFIDDRALNLECAGRLGMRTIHYQNPAQLEQALRESGIEL